MSDRGRIDVMAIAQRIERDLRAPISLESLATAAGCAPRELQRCFIEATGEGLMEYVRGRRLTIAMDEILRGTRRPLDVALELQFGSVAMLTHAFQARFAFPPRRFQSGRLSAHPAGKLPLTPDYVSMIASGALTLQPEIADGSARRLLGHTTLIPIGAQATAEGFAAIGDLIGRFRAELASLPNAADLLAAPLVLASQRVPERQRPSGDGLLIRAALDAERFEQIPPQVTEQLVPACRFAVFRYWVPPRGCARRTRTSWAPGSRARTGGSARRPRSPNWRAWPTGRCRPSSRCPCAAAIRIFATIRCIQRDACEPLPVRSVRYARGEGKCTTTSCCR